MKNQNKDLLVNKYLSELNEKLRNGESENFFYVFRGQSESSWKLDCAAARDKKYSRNLFKDVQEKLISDLRIKGLGYSQEKQKEFSDLEALADLRHYGTPSCLIDFTSNFLIALWFACEDKKYSNKDGRIFILNCYDTDMFSVVSSQTKDEPIKYFFQEKFHKLWYWVPEKLNQRLTEQDAVFIFGDLEIKEDKYLSITIQKEDKEDILTELEKFFDYTRATLFSDKYALGEYYQHLDKQKDMLDSSVYYIQTGEYGTAKAWLQQLINNLNQEKPEKRDLLLEAHFQLAYADMESTTQNIKELESDVQKQKGKDKDEAFSKIVESNISALELDKQTVMKNPLDYIQHFAHCESQNYKNDKIQNLKARMKNWLLAYRESKTPLLKNKNS